MDNSITYNIQDYKPSVKVNLPGTDIGILIFDSKDVGYLSKYLSILQLRAEISHSKRCQEYYRDDHDTYNEVIERDFQIACQLAINIIQAKAPKPTMTNKKYVDIDSLKSSLDIVEVAGRYTKLRKSGKNFCGPCPLHSEKKASFFVYPDSQSWHCFGACNTGGDAISLVMKAEHTDFKGAISTLGGGN
jgi:hypothetical protein